MWSTFFQTNWRQCKMREPAIESVIERCESELSVTLPLPLLQLLRESDGITGPLGEFLIFPVEEIIDCNVDMWLNHEYEGMYLPFESLLFFGGDEGDNLFAYPILGDRPDKSKIFRWRRDTDSRMFYANGLEQFFYMQWKCYEQNNHLLWDQTVSCKDFDDFRNFISSAAEVDFSPDDASPGSMKG